MEKMITRKEAAAFLGISIATLDSARINGQSPMSNMYQMDVCILHPTALKNI